jgi:peptidoglycan/xylan/chitin deacetylase (PgdA/CDA1 family)
LANAQSIRDETKEVTKMKTNLKMSLRPHSAKSLAAVILVLAALLGAGQTYSQTCNVVYSLTSEWTGGFQGDVKLTNEGPALSSWTLTWTFPNSQVITQLWNGVATQSGAAVTVKNASYNGSLATGALVDIGFTANAGTTNALPAAFSLNGAACSVNGSSSGGGTGSFSLKPSATGVSLSQGNSGTDTITVTDVSPFSGSVALAASGLPSGVTASFNPASTTASSTLTLTASSTASTGSSTVTITGTSGTLTTSTTITLTVSAASTGSFSLKPSSAALSIAQDQSATDTISIADVSPFSSAVSLTASGLPSGVTASFNPASSASSSTLTLAASSAAPAGSSTVTINGVSGSLSASTTIALTITSSGGGTPPADGIPLPSAGVQLQGVASGPITILNWGGFKAATSWTFDDSQPSQIQHYADIQAVGVPVTYYITSGTEGDTPNYNATWTEAANAGDELGNHTEDHCYSNLTTCITGTDTGNLATEIDNATAYILANFPQKAVWTGASPYGDTGYDSDASSRFFIYRGIEAGSMLPNDGTNVFNVPCHLAAQGETAAQFNAVTDAARSAGAWQIFLIHTITPTTAIWYNPVAVTDVTGSMTHAKTAGDTWVDSVVDIGAYWRGLKVLASANHTTSGVTTTWTWTLPAHFPSGKYLRVTVPSGTLSQNGNTITENPAGFYSVSLDAGSLTLVQ